MSAIVEAPEGPPNQARFQETRYEFITVSSWGCRVTLRIGVEGLSRTAETDRIALKSAFTRAMAALGIG